jgi:hypothetical protein
MDAPQFDRLVKTLAAGASRRQVVMGLAGGVAGGLLTLLGRSRADAKTSGLVAICHRTHDPTRPFIAIEVGASAVPEHLAHGDAIASDFATDVHHCGGCGRACAEGQVCVDGACQTADDCFICPGGQACLGNQCACIPDLGACGDSSACGLVGGFVQMVCHEGCCCIPNEAGGAYFCQPNSGDPHCCSGYCGPDGVCAPAP